MKSKARRAYENAWYKQNRLKHPEKVRAQEREYTRVYVAKNRAKVNATHSAWNKQWRIKNKEKYMWLSAKRRALLGGLDFNLEVSDVVIPGVCPVLGISIQRDNKKVNDNSPALDRVDNMKGYIKGNVAVISYRANRLKGDASVSDLKALLKYARVHQETAGIIDDDPEKELS